MKNRYKPVLVDGAVQKNGWQGGKRARAASSRPPSSPWLKPSGGGRVFSSLGRVLFAEVLPGVSDPWSSPLQARCRSTHLGAHLHVAV